MNFAAKNNIHILFHSICGSRIQAWFSWVPCKATVSDRTGFSSGVTRERIYFQAHKVIGSFYLLAGYQTEGLNFLLGVSLRLSLTSCCVVLFIRHLTTWQLFFQSQQRRKPLSKIGISISCKIILHLLSPLIYFVGK